MIALLRNLEWKPSTVSWLSFVLMGFIVASIGLSGTAHVVNYLQERLTAHGIEHNQEVAAALVPRFSSTFEDEAARRTENLTSAIEIYKAFGFEILIIDRENQSVIADSESTKAGSLAPVVSPKLRNLFPWKQGRYALSARMDTRYSSGCKRFRWPIPTPGS